MTGREREPTSAPLPVTGPSTAALPTGAGR